MSPTVNNFMLHVIKEKGCLGLWLGKNKNHVIHVLFLNILKKASLEHLPY